MCGEGGCKARQYQFNSLLGVLHDGDYLALLNPYLRQGRQSLAAVLADKESCSALGSGGGTWKQWKNTGSALQQNKKPQHVSNPIFSHHRMYSSHSQNNDGITHSGKVKCFYWTHIPGQKPQYSMQVLLEVFSANTGTPRELYGA